MQQRLDKWKVKVLVRTHVADDSFTSVRCGDGLWNYTYYTT